MEEQIRQAMAERRVVGFRHNGQRRIGEIHVFGQSKGRPQVLVFQTEGSSMMGPYPRWRTCALDDIARFNVTSRTFAYARLNPSGDFSEWDEVWAIVTD